MAFQPSDNQIAEAGARKLPPRPRASLLGKEAMRAEEERQAAYIEKTADLVRARIEESGRRMQACVVTFGCQMNARDSEKLRGILTKCGFEDIEAEEEADLVIYNTCTVRENADNHLYGRLGRIGSVKRAHPERFVALCGCMMQENHVVAKIRKSYPFVDLVFGTHNLHAFPELLYRMLTSDNRVIEIREAAEALPEHMPVQRKYAFKSGVNIMYGCNNFCTYCIVPYVRGEEISREREDILSEIRALAADGVREVMLLGQNVNSYGKTLNPPVSFAELLLDVAAIEGIDRVRFMTSHPKDLSEELIQVMAEEPKVARHLHLPVQSGSTRVLAAMNRHYTREDYLNLVARLRQALPDISLTTDIIVGFPGETEEEFQDTLSLVAEVGYDSAFTFIYSRRTGTPAAAMENQIPDDVAHDRFDRLLAAVKASAEERCARFTGTVRNVLVEESNREKGLVTGRISENIVVHFPGDASLIGQIVPVKLSECRGFYYIGERVS